MARSLRFRQLQRDLAELRRHLLPQRFSPIGAYSSRVISRTASYRILAHAEIESYLEERTLEVATAALLAFRRHGIPSRTAMCMIGFIGRNLDEPPSSITNPDPGRASTWADKLQIESKLTDASNALRKAVTDNHGVKEKNILRLLIPIGVNHNNIDPIWLTTMNTFGEQRGLLVHSSRSSWRTSQAPDPRTEYNRVQDVMSEMKNID